MIDAAAVSWNVVDIWHGYPHRTGINPDQRDLYLKILKRDNNTCYFCGFKSQNYQEVHHLNHNHSDFSTSNLVCACSMCHRSFHPNLLQFNNAGKLIYFPGITQQELNHILRAMMVADYRSRDIFNNEEFAKYAMAAVFKSKINNFDSAVTSLFKTIGADVSNQAKNQVDIEFIKGLSGYAQILLNLKSKYKEKFSELYEPLSGFKVLHLPESLELQTKHWAEHDFPESLDKWDIS